MKKSKKLMLLGLSLATGAVAATSTVSSFAWFSMNTKVTATGMLVQASAKGGIEIVYGSSTDAYVTGSISATAGMTTATALQPTSTTNVKNWYTATAAAANAYNAISSTYSELTLSAGNASKKIAGSDTVAQDTTQMYDADGYQYFLVKNFAIRSTNASALAKGLKVESVSVSGNTKTLSKALRTVVKVGDKTLFYAPVYESDTAASPNPDVFTYTVYSGYDSTNKKATEAGTVTTTDKNTATLIGASGTTTIPAKGATENGGVDAQIYIYFEGEDANLYSENLSVEALTVSVNFTADID